MARRKRVIKLSPSVTQGNAGYATMRPINDSVRVHRKTMINESVLQHFDTHDAMRGAAVDGLEQCDFQLNVATFH